MAPRRAISGAARLALAFPPCATGFATMVASLSAYGILAVGVMAGLGIAVAGVATDLLPVGTNPVVLGAFGGVFALAGVWVWVDVVRETVRDGLRTEPAAMVARTRVPDEAREDEAVAVATLSRLCRQVALPVPALRVRETDRPLCYTVRYPVETSPRELLKADVDRFRSFNAATREDDWMDDEEPIPEDHVVVVSTGLLAALPSDELGAVLAHEVAHVRNDDLRMMNVALLPVFWAGSVLDLPTRNDPADYLVAGERWVRGTFVRAATLAGVGVVSRGREYAADAAAAELVGDPAALARALERLDAGVTPAPDEDLRTVGVLNVLPGTSEDRLGLLRSHPPTEARIARLRGLVEG